MYDGMVYSMTAVIVLCILTHWGRMKHICVFTLSIIGSGDGLLTGRRQDIILSNYRILSIQTLGTNISEILSKIHMFSFRKMPLKMSANWWLFRLNFNVLTVSLADISIEVSLTTSFFKDPSQMSHARFLNVLKKVQFCYCTTLTKVGHI